MLVSIPFKIIVVLHVMSSWCQSLSLISTCLILFKSLWSQWYQSLFFLNHSELQVSVSYFCNHSGATAYLSLSFKKLCGATIFKIKVELLVSVSFFKNIMEVELLVSLSFF